MKHNVQTNFPFSIYESKHGYSKIGAMELRYFHLIRYFQIKLKNTAKKNQKEIRAKIKKYKKLKFNLRDLYPEEFI